MQKKILRFKFIVLALLFVFAPVIARGEMQISVTIDGVAVNFADQQPTIVENRTLVPVRGVFEQLGFYVTWNGYAQQATLTRADFTVIISVGSSAFTTNGASHYLDVPAQVIGGSTMLPIRAVLESVGYALEWDESARTVLITTEQIAETSYVPTVTASISEAEVYERIMAMKEQFPEGMRWTNDDYYVWDADILGIHFTGFGCVAFAFIMSDAAFGNLPARRYYDFDNIRVGDILRINHDTHSVVVLEIDGNRVTVTEGNWNSSVHWGRVITMERIVETGTYIITRYPIP